MFAVAVLASIFLQTTPEVCECQSTDKAQAHAFCKRFMKTPKRGKKVSTDSKSVQNLNECLRAFSKGYDSGCSISCGSGVDNAALLQARENACKNKVHKLSH